MKRFSSVFMLVILCFTNIVSTSAMRTGENSSQQSPFGSTFELIQQQENTPVTTDTPTGNSTPTSPTFTDVPTDTVTPLPPTEEITPTVDYTSTGSPTASPTNENTATIAPSITPTPDNTVTVIASPTPNADATATATPPETPTPTETETPSTTPIEGLMGLQSESYSGDGLDESTWESASILPFDSALVSGATGAGTFSYPIDLPAGPGGIQPAISLDYNSGTIDGAFNYTNSGLTGLGWSVNNGAMIERNLHSGRTVNDDTFSMVFGNTSYSLIPQAKVTNISYSFNGTTYTGYIEYKSSDSNFWKIRRYQNTLPNRGGTEMDFWVAWDKTGSRYTFDYRAWYYDLPFNGTDNNPITTRPWSWYLTQQTEPSGKNIVYHYMSFITSKCYSSDGCGYSSNTTIAVYPYDIVYPDNHTYVKFTYDSGRSDYNSSYSDDHSLVHYDDLKLSAIQIYNDPTSISFNNGSATKSYNGITYNIPNTVNDDSLTNMVREYKLEYYADTEAPIFPNAHVQYGNNNTSSRRILALKSIQKFGISEAQYLPKTTFYYEDGMHLTRIDNGQGGTVSFAYDSPILSNSSAPYSADDVEGNGSGGLGTGEFAVGNSWGVWLSSPTGSIRPGGGYLFQCNIQGAGVYSVHYYANGNNGQNVTYSPPISVNGSSGNDVVAKGVVFLTPLTSDNPSFAIEETGTTHGGGSVYNCNVKQALTRYRVRSKTVSDGFWGEFTFTYAYSDGVTNDSAHSSLIQTVSSDYRFTPAYTEFRGHQTVTVTDTYGQKTTTTYAMTDGKVGSPTEVQVYTGDLNGAHTMYSDVTTNYVINPILYTPNDTINQAYCIKTSQNQSICAKDQQVFWNYATDVISKTYGGNGDNTHFTGTQTTYQYNAGDQGGQQNGNQTRAYIGVWNGSSYPQYRGIVTTYIPNLVDNDDPYQVKFLTGLPAFSINFQCPDHNCNSEYDSTNNIVNNANILSETCNIYTPASICYNDNGLHSAIPASPLLLGVRKLLRFDGDSPIYSDTTYQYNTEWGIQTGITTFAGEGSASSQASTSPSVTQKVYDIPNHPTWLLQTIVNPSGLNLVTQESYPAGSNSTYLNIPGAETDPNGATTTTIYDSLGRTVSITGPTNAITSISYHNYSPVIPSYIEVTAPTIHEKIYTNGVGESIQDQNLSVTTVDGVRDLITKTKYDTYGRVTNKDTNPVEQPQGFGFDTNYLPASSNSTSTTFDAFGRTTQVNYPDGRQESWSYSINDADHTSITDHTDGKGIVSRTVTDGLERTIRVIPNIAVQGPITVYNYNVDDSVGSIIQTTQSDPFGTSSNLRTEFTYDLGGRKLTMHDPNMGGTSIPWTYTYDALGNLIKQVDAGNNTSNIKNSTCIWYDSANRPTGKVYGQISGTVADCNPHSADPGDNKDIVYHYDESGNRDLTNIGISSFTFQNGIGKRTSMIDPSGKTYWVYDIRGNISKEVRDHSPVGFNLAYIFQYTFNPDNSVNTITYPDGEVVTAEYSSTGQPTALTSSQGQPNYVGTTTNPNTQYDSSDRLINLPFGNNDTLSYSYYSPYQNGQGNLLEQIKFSNQTRTLFSMDFDSYDEDGNLLLASNYNHDVNNYVSKQDLSYVYDGLGRIASVVTNTNVETPAPYTNYSQAYDYDPNSGLPITFTDVTNNVTKSYTYDTQHPNAVSQYSGSGSTYSYTYDHNGNMISRSEGSSPTPYIQTWTPENKLKQVSWSNNVTTYVYDGDGNLAFKIEKNTYDGTEVTMVYVDDMYEQKIATTAKNNTGKIWYPE
jgi:YD repeat-containing protein